MAGGHWLHSSVLDAESVIIRRRAKKTSRCLGWTSQPVGCLNVELGKAPFWTRTCHADKWQIISGRLGVPAFPSRTSSSAPETPHCRFEFNTQRISALKQLLLCCRPRFKCWRYKELSEFCQASLKFCLCVQGKKIGVHFRDLTSPSLLKSVVSVIEHEACVCQSRSASSRSF